MISRFIEGSFLNVNKETFHISNFCNLPLHLEFQTRVASVVNSASETLPDYRKAKKAILAGFEKNYLEKLLDKNEWNVSQSAREIKMHRSGFQRLMRKYGLRRET